MHRCPDCGERFEGNICTFCGRPVPQEELEPAPQTNAAEQATPQSQENSTPEQIDQPINDYHNSYNPQSANDYAQTGYNPQPTNSYAQSDYTSQQSYGNSPFQNGTMPNSYAAPPYMAENEVQSKKKSKTALIVVLALVGVIIISLGVVGYNILRTAINKEKYMGAINVSKSIQENDIHLDESSHCYYTNNDDGTVKITELDVWGYYDNFTDEVVDDKYIFNFVIPSEIDGKTVTDIAPIETSNPVSSGIFNIHLTIPGTVKTIKSDTFNRTEHLTDITLEDGVTTLEQDAIIDCPSLRKIHIPESVTNIGNHAAGFRTANDTFKNPVGEREYARATLCYLCVKEGSAADRYAQDNDLYIEYE